MGPGPKSNVIWSHLWVEWRRTKKTLANNCEFGVRMMMMMTAAALTMMMIEVVVQVRWKSLANSMLNVCFSSFPERKLAIVDAPNNRCPKRKKRERNSEKFETERENPFDRTQNLEAACARPERVSELHWEFVRSYCNIWTNIAKLKGTSVNLRVELFLWNLLQKYDCYYHKVLISGSLFHSQTTC